MRIASTCVNVNHMPDLMFRPMKLEDIPRVQEIDRLSFSLPWPEKSYRFELTENPAALATVVEIDGDMNERYIIGMSIAWILEDEAHIATIAIHPEYRRHGYGEKLLLQTLRSAYQRGASLATLEVRQHNLAALRMYHKFGFITAGRREKYYMDNDEDALIMTLFEMGPGYFSYMADLN
jgi:ribosomal-protein-alanine N-acetyltransferase